jgi:hypothetical protein
MNDSKSDKNAKKVVLAAYENNEIIVLLQKLHSDFNMLDSKMKEILNTDRLDMKILGNIAGKFNVANKELSEYAELRNKKIEELLKTIKN